MSLESYLIYTNKAQGKGRGKENKKKVVFNSNDTTAGLVSFFFLFFLFLSLSPNTKSYIPYTPYIPYIHTSESLHFSKIPYLDHSSKKNMFI